MTKQLMTIDALLEGYRTGKLKLQDFLREKLAEAKADNHNAWISTISEQQLQGLIDNLTNKSIDDLPLYGIPFAVKDNIDFSLLPTTAGCVEYSYQPEQSSQVVQLLIDAGAIPLGKTNLDQFATGLVGVRSPWGAAKNSFDPEYISGGSSAGSAVSVAMGQVTFSLGTDTAGSGRVPAALNNIVGLKATKGLLSCTGVVPACKSLDCVTIFANTVTELNLLLDIAGQYDPDDCYSRKNTGENNINQYQPLKPLKGLKIGLPAADQLQFFGDQQTEALFAKNVALLESAGAELLPFNLQPFLDAAKLLYEGPWVAERFAAIEDFFTQDPKRCLPVIETIVGGAVNFSAVDTFKYMYQLQAYKIECDEILSAVDCVITPTAGSTYTIDQVNADPIKLNSNMGYYTNFMNLLDYTAIAVPAGFASKGLPFGVTFFGPAFSDRLLMSAAAQLQQINGFTLGATNCPFPPLQSQPLSDTPAGYIDLAVCGAHLSGFPLNIQLQGRQGQLVKTCKTASDYRFYALAGGPPLRPGLIRVPSQGVAIEVEVWRIPEATLGSFLVGIPQPLGLGKVELEDGSWVSSFICEGYAVDSATDISEFGGWRGYIESLK